MVQRISHFWTCQTRELSLLPLIRNIWYLEAYEIERKVDQAGLPFLCLCMYVARNLLVFSYIWLTALKMTKKK